MDRWTPLASDFCFSGSVCPRCSMNRRRCISRASRHLHSRFEIDTPHHPRILGVGLEVSAGEADEVAVASCGDLRGHPWLCAEPFEGFAVEWSLALFP
jgi:hypothetical protein